MRIDSFRSLVFHGLRFGFRLMPLPTGTRDRLRQRFLSRHADLIPTPPRGRAVAGSARRPADHAAHRLIDHREKVDAPLPSVLPATLVAFYLPQFHPFPENDAWWGKGFTEWRNVARALPQFEGHVQPRLPADLGFYDLRLRETMHEQADLAKAYGIGAFCSYFYWFGGKTLMEAPLRSWLADPSLDMAICLCWANENWSRRWDGRADDILIAQDHSADDDLAFIAHVSDYLKDPRYLRVDGKPMLLVYRPGLLPEPKQTAARWRAWCRDSGLGEIHLAYVQSFDNVDPRTIGFDSAVGFPPNNTTARNVTAGRTLLNPDYAGELLDWRDLAESVKEADYPLYPAVNPGWDNEARRSGRGRTFVHASPAGYAAWLRKAITAARHRMPAQPMVFVNAWNEWAEGAVLEPDTARGHAWLDATRSALLPLPRHPRPVALLHVWHVDLLPDILHALKASCIDWRIVATTTEDRETAAREVCQRLGFTAEWCVYPNRGRDVLPFLRAAAPLLLDGTRTILKLHTKKTEHREDGDRWRRDLLSALLAPERARRLLDALHATPDIGFIAPDAHALPLTDYMGANAPHVRRLSERLGIVVTDDDRFIAGSMFWAKVEALRPVYDMDLATWEFEEEAGQVDGTLAHAIERVVTLGAARQGLCVREANDVLGEPTAARFTYAKESRA
ncbi:glycoside hydrolase family 99-like domain-containing protein [Luteibacter sp. PPL201]|uniref:Glycoside hydrolase family 99-like domain-containing protein n=1 Tax=Luteibacter sahnii TaxID=3021977 RepID=A0ABT6B9R7_9GAMM